jgi:hypothetical protein
MRNENVAARWSYGRVGSTRHLMTDGVNLYSYQLKIGTTNPQGKKILFDYTSPGGDFRSQTTSCHVGLARRYADITLRGDSPIVRTLSV